MIVAEVTGRIWSERQIVSLQSHRMVTLRAAGSEVALVAVDLVDSAAGNLVLVATDEAAQAAVGGDPAGIDAAVVALVAGGDVLDEQASQGRTA
jgi:ethanolamine utilization protein EutN